MNEIMLILEVCAERTRLLVDGPRKHRQRLLDLDCRLHWYRQRNPRAFAEATKRLRTRAA